MTCEAYYSFSISGILPFAFFLLVHQRNLREALLLWDFEHLYKSINVLIFVFNSFISLSLYKSKSKMPFKYIKGI